MNTKLNYQFITAAENGNLKSIKSLLQQEINIEFTDYYAKYTALMYACKKGHLDIVEYLVQHGANIEAKDNNGYTPLIIASIYNHLEIVKFLIKSGANVENKTTINNSTVLLLTSMHGHLNIIKYLVRNGANINVKDNDDHTASMIANYNNHNETVNYLKNDAYIESSLGPNYNYNKDKKQQIIDAVKKNPSIIEHLNKEELSNIPEISHLLNSDEYGLFEKKILKFSQWSKFN